MKKVLFCILMLPFFVFADDFYDCKYSEGDKTKKSLKRQGNGSIWVSIDRFIARDYVKNEYKSPVFSKYVDNLSIAEDVKYVYVHCK